LVDKKNEWALLAEVDKLGYNCLIEVDRQVYNQFFDLDVIHEVTDVLYVFFWL
jgi:hypothetical protein